MAHTLLTVIVSGALALCSNAAVAAPATKPGPATTTAPSTKPTTTTAPTTPPPAEPVPVEPKPTEPEPAEPEPTEPEPAEPTPITNADPAAVAALQQEARALRDELFKARGRVSLVAAKLFTTRVTLRLRSNLERFYTVSNLTLRIDGAPVYVQDAGMPATDGDLFEVFAAPGSHELSVSADLVSRRDATYKIRFDHSTVITVEVDQRVSTKLLVRETGNMWRFAKSKRGRSDMRIALRAKSKSTAKGSAKAKGGASVKVGGKK
jgi:hypothetical protein